jgi:DNA-binding NarL/FixJ family response regulator
MAYDRAAYTRTMRRKRAINRLAIALDYDGPLTDRGVPQALGEFILHRWRSDDSTHAHEKVERLLEALRAAPEVAEREIEEYLARLDMEFDGLTTMERRTLYFLSVGFVPKQIAKFEGVSDQAIKERMRKVYRKLGVHSSTHAVAYCIRRNWLWH